MARALQNYSDRMQDIDWAFAEMKQTESITDIDDIENTLTRYSEANYINSGKIYDISRTLHDVIQQNAAIVQHNAKMEIIIRKLGSESSERIATEMNETKTIAEEVEILAPQADYLEKEYIGIKKILGEELMRWEHTAISKYTPMMPDMDGFKFTKLGVLDPIKVLGMKFFIIKYRIF